MTRVNKGRSSGPAMSSGAKHSAMYFSGALWAVAKKIKPEPKSELVEVKPRKIGRPHMSDDEIIEIIKMHKNGVSIRELADMIDKDESWVRNICQGVNRGHLLRMVEEGHSDYRMGWKHKK